MLKILFADDSMTAQNMGKKILTDAGYDVIAVSNGAAAAKKILEQPPDIAILDVHMPGYTGFEVCAKIRAAHETAKMPVLLTVGKMEPYSVEDGARVKADGVIIKPFEASVLLATVRNLAERLGPTPSSDSGGNFGTMRLEVPTFEEFRDESYAAWKAETAQIETLHQPASVPVPPAMANAPAYNFDDTIAIPPPVPPAGSPLPFRDTVEMQSLSAMARAPKTQPLSPATPSIDETQPIHPYVDAYEEEQIHAAVVHPPVEEHNERQEFTAVFSTPEDAVEIYEPPISTPVHEPAPLPVPERTAAAVVSPPASSLPAIASAPTPDAGSLETFEEFSEPVHVRREPELELTAHSSEDIAITPDPAFEHSTMASSSVDAPIGTAPGLVTTGTESIELAQVKAAATFPPETSGTKDKIAEQVLPPPEEAHLETPEVAAASAAVEPEHTESHDAAFEKLVSELLAREPAPAVSDSPEETAASPEKPPQSFFSKYLGFGRGNRPPGTSSHPRVEDTFKEETPEEAETKTESFQDLHPKDPHPKIASAPAVQAPISASSEPGSSGLGVDDFKMDFESGRGTKAPLKEPRIPDVKAPATSLPSNLERKTSITNTEAGMFVGSRDFSKSAKPATQPTSSIPFTASSFRDEPVKPRKESHDFEDLESSSASEPVSKVPPFTASFSEAPLQTRKEPRGFEDLSLATPVISEPTSSAPVAEAAPAKPLVVQEATVSEIISDDFPPEEEFVQQAVVERKPLVRHEEAQSKLPVIEPAAVVEPVKPEPVKERPPVTVAAAIAPAVIPAVAPISTPPARSTVVRQASAPVPVVEPPHVELPHVAEVETHEVESLEANAAEIESLEVESPEVTHEEVAHEEVAHAEIESEEISAEEEFDPEAASELVAAEHATEIEALPDSLEAHAAEGTAMHSAAQEHPVGTAVPDHNHMVDAELAQQLAAALEQHAHLAQSATSMNGQPYAASPEEAAAVSTVVSIDAESVSLIITKVLDRMVPEIVRLIAVELENHRSRQE